ncbi:MAG: hypothetical protein JSU01_11360 [Bacteroidetes bacterium]|nr:hypothetical protein [Bacteroidota bacterium]
MNYNSLKYSARVWLSTIAFAPAIFCAGVFFDKSAGGNQASTFVTFYLLFAFYEFVFSLITWLVFWIIVELITWLIGSNIIRKTLLTFVSVALTVATFRIFPLFESFSLSDSFCDLMLINCACIGLGCWLFTPEPETALSPTNQYPGETWKSYGPTTNDHTES